MDLHNEIQLFFAEFSTFEMHFVGLALRAVSNDLSLVEGAEKVLDLEARLTLLKRMAFVRNVDPSLIAQIAGINVQAAQLRDKRDELSHNLRRVERARAAPTDTASERVWVPTLDEIQECRNGTTHLQHALQSIAERVQVH